eukprot:scaffold28227_cov118-Isochrysis_galbana.AAC.2
MNERGRVTYHILRRTRENKTSDSDSAPRPRSVGRGRGSRWRPAALVPSRQRRTRPWTSVPSGPALWATTRARRRYDCERERASASLPAQSQRTHWPGCCSGCLCAELRSEPRPQAVGIERRLKAGSQSLQKLKKAVTAVVISAHNLFDPSARACVSGDHVRRCMCVV